MKVLAILLLFFISLNLSAAIPLRSLFIRSYEDMNQEYLPVRRVENYDDNVDEIRSKRGLDLLKRRVEIIERNRCFFNPITCY